MARFRQDERGTATMWFAVAAFVISAGSLASAFGLAWLTETGRISLVAIRDDSRPVRAARSPSNDEVDEMPTGSIAPSKALVIRLR